MRAPQDVSAALASAQRVVAPALSFAQETLAPLVASATRRARRRPFLTGSVLALLTVTVALRRFNAAAHGGMGRWYWNWAVSFHPALAYILPWGDWDAVENRPRWVQEIYESKWPGEWDVPKLSRPVYAPVSSSSSHGGAHRLAESHASDQELISPAILKLHVFSTAVSEKSYRKRQLVRSLSPLKSLPPQYRHLVELKFVLGYPLEGDGWDDTKVNMTMEAALQEEQAQYGDLFRLDGLWRGENLREGKILQWIRDVGLGKDSPRKAWYLFKLDDDAVVNLPNLLDLLISLDMHTPTYLGTSLARWPSYHFHFTGFLTGFNYGLYKTLSEGIDKMPKTEVQAAWDDDVLTGELMWTLPSAPPCRLRPARHGDASTDEVLPDYCDPKWTAPWGWQPPPPNPNPRSGLLWHDFYHRAFDPAWKLGQWLGGGDLATHSWWFKFPEYYQKEHAERIQGKVWDPPHWIKELADPSPKHDHS